MNKIKKILIGIFIIIIILIVLILVFYYINKNNIRKEEALKNNENKVDMVYEYAKQNNIYKTEENIEALKESIANRFKLLEDENKFFEINNIIQKYYENLILEKDQVIYDKEELKKLNIKIIADNFIKVEDDVLRHNIAKLGFHIYSYLLKGD